MKIDPVVKKESIRMTIGILVCIAVTQVLFFIFGKYNFSVLLGSIYGGVLALLNFFLMGLTIQSAASMEDKDMAKKKIQASYGMRQFGLMFFIGLGMYISVKYEIFNWLSILIAMVYPRITIAFLTFADRKKE